MPAASGDVYKILYSVGRYLLPVLALLLVLIVLAFIISEAHARRERVRGLPGSGTVGELIVLSGSRDLDVNTWFPVPREGVLGSIRSCDLVIPCPGVRTKHLDFSWEDGIGLLIRPRTGCEAAVNGVPVTCRTDAAAVPLVHGGILQVGSAVLRLHVFAALDTTAAAVMPQPSEMMPAGTEIPAPPMPAPMPMPVYSPAKPGFTQDSVQGIPLQEMPAEQLPPQEIPMQESSMQSVPEECTVSVSPETSADRPESVSSRPRRSDRWKEDFGE